MAGRERLSLEAILTAAVAVADRGGLVAVSMRNVAREVGVEAMSLYHHVANKEALLDELGDWIFAQIEVPEPGETWRVGMRRRAGSARAVLAGHPWALSLIESRRNPGRALLTHHNAVLGCLRDGGFPVDLAAHAFSVIDAYVYGFALTERNLPAGAATETGDFAAEISPAMQDYPYLVELVTELTADGDYSFVREFEHGLDLILDQLEHRLARQ